jgi:hypothetical protein
MPYHCTAKRAQGGTGALALCYYYNTTQTNKQTEKRGSKVIVLFSSSKVIEHALKGLLDNLTCALHFVFTHTHTLLPFTLTITTSLPEF